MFLINSLIRGHSLGSPRLAGLATLVFSAQQKTFPDSVVGSMILNAPTQKALVLHSISFISDNFVDRAYWIGSQFSKGNSTYVEQ